jgi:hypothetical protein
MENQCEDDVNDGDFYYYYIVHYLSADSAAVTEITESAQRMT